MLPVHRKESPRSARSSHFPFSADAPCSFGPIRKGCPAEAAPLASFHPLRCAVSSRHFARRRRRRRRWICETNQQGPSQLRFVPKAELLGTRLLVPLQRSCRRRCARSVFFFRRELAKGHGGFLQLPRIRGCKDGHGNAPNKLVSNRCNRQRTLGFKERQRNEVKHSERKLWVVEQVPSEDHIEFSGNRFCLRSSGHPLESRPQKRRRVGRESDQTA